MSASEERTAYKRKWAKEAYGWRKSHGICVKCGANEERPGKVMCLSCSFQPHSPMTEEHLRAQRSPAQLDRSRWEGCDICIFFEDGKPIESMHGDIVVKHPGYSSTEFIRHGECYDYRAGSVLGDFEFCPFCGRPLTEAAWAELERRIGGNDGKTD